LNHAKVKAGTRGEPWGKPSRRVLYAHVPGRIEYWVRIPEKGRLAFGRRRPRALTMTWSVPGPIPQMPTLKHLQKDLIGRSAGAARKPGPLVTIPDTATTVKIDPRR
jgi:hypothetical protein